MYSLYIHLSRTLFFLTIVFPQVIDLLVKLLQCPLKDGDEEPHMIRIFKEAYDVLHAYMVGKSRKNALYFAKYIDFFQTQFTQKVRTTNIEFYICTKIAEITQRNAVILIHFFLKL